MKKPEIKEVIVVEGKHDKERILKVVDADILISNGTHCSKEFLDLCKTFNEQRGLIVFTDPDGPGEYIRRKIIEHVGTTKHASLHVIQTKKKQKVGIEHADLEDIIEALKNVATFDTTSKSLTWTEFIELGLTADDKATLRREALSEALRFPRSNAKTTFKYLNMMGISQSQCIAILKESHL